MELSYTYSIRGGAYLYGNMLVCKRLIASVCFLTLCLMVVIFKLLLVAQVRLCDWLGSEDPPPGFVCDVWTDPSRGSLWHGHAEPLPKTQLQDPCSLPVPRHGSTDPETVANGRYARQSPYNCLVWELKHNWCGFMIIHNWWKEWYLGKFCETCHFFRSVALFYKALP